MSTENQSESGESSTVVETESSSGVDVPATGRNWGVLALALLMGLAGGLAAALALGNYGLALPAFVIAWAGVTYYLRDYPTKLKALAVGLMADGLLFAPSGFLFYLAEMGKASQMEGAAGAGASIGSALGFLIWGVGFAMLGMILVVAGYILNGHANKKIEKAESTPAQTTTVTD